MALEALLLVLPLGALVRALYLAVDAALDKARPALNQRSDDPAAHTQQQAQSKHSDTLTHSRDAWLIVSTVRMLCHPARWVLGT